MSSAWSAMWQTHSDPTNANWLPHTGPHPAPTDQGEYSLTSLAFSYHPLPCGSSPQVQSRVQAPLPGRSRSALPCRLTSPSLSRVPESRPLQRSPAVCPGLSGTRMSLRSPGDWGAHSPHCFYVALNHINHSTYAHCCLHKPCTQ